jgi:hypothetical protein
LKGQTWGQREPFLVYRRIGKWVNVPSVPGFSSWLGRALEDKGQTPAAAAAYAAALQIAPQMTEAQQRLDGLRGKKQ